MKFRAILALALPLIGLAILAPSASASAARPVAYPPTTCATISVSTTTPAVGEAITVTGKNFGPHAKVTLILQSKTYVLGTVTTSATGTFGTDVTMPRGLTGHHILSAQGGNPLCQADPIEIVIGANGASPTPGPNGPPGTAFTGVDVLWLIALAAALIVVGIALNRRSNSRRRRSRHSHSA
jgi:hypothetical protein